jgi:hypothetical protein
MLITDLECSLFEFAIDWSDLESPVTSDNVPPTPDEITAGTVLVSDLGGSKDWCYVSSSMASIKDQYCNYEYTYRQRVVSLD